MKLKFYGTRGSIPSPSAKWRDFYTHEFGGNTTSALVTLPDSKRLHFLDAGTGIMVAGDDVLRGHPEVAKGEGELNLYLTHVHWDHIQGFPFFRTAYRKGDKLTIYGNPTNIEPLMGAIAGSNPMPMAEYAMREQMKRFLFPIRLEHVGGTLQFKEIEDMALTDRYELRHQKLFHPDGVYSYKFVDRETDRALVFATDTELDCKTLDFGPKERRTMEWVGDCDVVIHEGQYTEGEYSGSEATPYEDASICKAGWGHSVPKKVVEVLLATLEQKAPKQLYVTHHDPKHDDAFLRKLEAETQEYAAKRLRELGRNESDLIVRFAREGDEVGLDPTYARPDYHFLGRPGSPGDELERRSWERLGEKK